MPRGRSNARSPFLKRENGGAIKGLNRLARLHQGHGSLVEVSLDDVL
jgi:hypothetical protein